MKADGRQLDPEIAGLLREIPRFQGLAILNRPLKDVPGYAQSYGRRGTRQPSNPERHLIEVYREEVAWLLRQAAACALRTGPSSIVVEHVGMSSRLEVPSSEQLSAEVRHYEQSAGWQQDPSVVAALKELSSMIPIRAEYATRLASASVDLAPTCDYRILLALALSCEGRTKSAEELLLEIVSQQATALDASVAWNNLGLVRVAQGSRASARDAFSAGALASPNPAPAMSWLFNACMIGDRDDALTAAKYVDELVPIDHPAVDEFLAKRITSKGLTPEFVSASARLRDKVGATTRRLLNV